MQQKDSGEIKTISTMKTMMMILVVIYHCAALWMPVGWFNQAPKIRSDILGMLAEWLNYIHIYSFTFASGWLFYYSYIERKNTKNFTPILKKRFKRLIIPYIIVSIIWLLPFEIVYFHPTAGTLINKFVLGTSPRQLWFLLMLFNVNLLFVVAKSFLNRLKIGVHFIAGSAFLYIIGIGASLLIRIGIPNFFQILTAVRYLLFFYLGYCFRKYGSKLLSKMNVCLSAFANIVLFSVLQFIKYNYIEIGAYMTVLLKPILCISGIVLSYRVASLLCNNGFFQKYKHMKMFFEKDAFGIYMFHQQIIWIIINILNRESVWPFFTFIVCFLLSMMCSIAITEILRKIRPLGKLLQL